MGMWDSLKGITNTIGKVASKYAPGISAIITTAEEIPKISKAFQNGDGFQQLGRSACKVAGVTLATAASIPLFALGPPGWIAGIGLGFAGDFVGGKIGDAVFGKSREDQKKEYQEQMEKYGKQDMSGFYNQSANPLSQGLNPMLNANSMSGMTPYSSPYQQNNPYQQMNPYQTQTNPYGQNLFGNQAPMAV